MKIIKVLVVVFILMVVGMQFIPTTLNQSNDIFVTDMIASYKMPEDIEVIIKTSCYDCHSNNTNYPWYNKIQPLAWILKKHIEEGKNELNFNEFGSYSIRKQKSKFKSMISQIKKDKMPLKPYLIMHKKAKLLDNNKSMLIDYLEKLNDSLK